MREQNVATRAVAGVTHKDLFNRLAQACTVHENGVTFVVQLVEHLCSTFFDHDAGARRRARCERLAGAAAGRPACAGMRLKMHLHSLALATASGLSTAIAWHTTT
jgi:hypothetical protein